MEKVKMVEMEEEMKEEVEEETKKETKENPPEEKAPEEKPLENPLVSPVDKLSEDRMNSYIKYNVPIALHPTMFIKLFRKIYKKGIQTGYEVGYSDAIEKMEIALEKVKNSWAYMNDKKIQELVFEKHRYADTNSPEYIMKFIKEFMKENGLI